MSPIDHEFVHVVDRPEAPQTPTSAQTLVLLHGTGGNETSLIGLAKTVAPHGHLLGIRGRSTEEGITRYFRRFDAITYDQEHIAQESDALATFINDSVDEHNLPRPVIAMGYSNGANIALAIMMRHPDVFDQAILLRPVMPVEDPPVSDLKGKNVLVLLGQTDPYRPYADEAVTYLKQHGASVEVKDFVGIGHELSRQDVEVMTNWIKNYPSSR